jgi:predicted enzyme related to lactoylglutathione lyase
MASDEEQPVGIITWADLTVEDAPRIRDFYRDVIGWDVSEVDMDDYADYCMNEPQEGEAVAGICHARGVNAGLPPQWLVYIRVADLDASAQRCVERGGEIVAGPNPMGEQGRYCVIRDPAGAVAALFEQLD